MTGPAPDFSEPIVGFRAWRVDDGELVPWSASSAGAWTPGVNQARCLHVGAHPREAPPVAACSCGLYALADLSDDRLRPHHEAVGAIVAWGAVEVHATGFRAEYAAIVALGAPGGASPPHWARLREAAGRYGVPLVPVTHLPDAALEYGRPIAFDSILVPRRRGLTLHRDPVPPLDGTGVTAGVALDEHLEVTIADGEIRMEPTAPLAEALRGRELAWAAPGTPLTAGDTLARAGDLRLATPVGGRVGAAGSLVPSAWDDEGHAISWGAAGRRFYAAQVADARRRSADPFAPLRIRWLHAHARIRSAADVLGALREQRARPRFPSPRELQAFVVEAAELALADRGVARAVARLSQRLVWRLHDPEADLVLDPRGPSIGLGEPRPGDVVLHASAEAADDWLAGRLDLAAALRRREVQSAAPLAAVLRAASVLKPLQPRYAEASSRASSFAG